MRNNKLFSIDIEMVENGYIVREDINKSHPSVVGEMGDIKVFESLNSLIEFLINDFDVNADFSKD